MSCLFLFSLRMPFAQRVASGSAMRAAGCPSRIGRPSDREFGPLQYHRVCVRVRIVPRRRSGAQR